MDIFGDVYGAFETAADDGAKSLTDECISQEWADAITEIANKNITPPEVHITGMLILKLSSRMVLMSLLKLLKQLKIMVTKRKKSRFNVLVHQDIG